jgi:hypothetical protein
MVYGMAVLPLIEGCQNNRTKDQPKPVVCSLRTKKRTMAAIMENYVEPHKKTSRWNSKHQSKPKPDLKTAMDQIPNRQKLDQ